MKKGACQNVHYLKYLFKVTRKSRITQQSEEISSTCDLIRHRGLHCLTEVLVSWVKVKRFIGKDPFQEIMHTFDYGLTCTTFMVAKSGGFSSLEEPKGPGASRPRSGRPVFSSYTHITRGRGSGQHVFRRPYENGGCVRQDSH